MMKRWRQVYYPPFCLYDLHRVMFYGIVSYFVIFAVIS
jgi:hypothetical protein